MESEGLLPRYQRTANQPNSGPHEFSLRPLIILFKTVLPLFPPLSLGLSRDVFPSGLMTNICYALLVPAIRSV